MRVTVEILAEDLKRLIGWGAQPSRLALIPSLRSLAGLPEESVNFKRDGLTLRRHLITAIDSLAGMYEFHGIVIPAEKIRRSIRLVLKIEGSGLDAPQRRARAITVLGLFITVDTWRRPEGPEWDLILILAESMATKPAPR